MKNVINWNEVARIATTMTCTQLHYARMDCLAAGNAAWDLEKSGIAVSKDQGYYLDESSVYAAEQTRRLTAPKVATW
tara:strand:+ start:1476 stop:1706 length:231 start_codon:yes stop_codon:yes gene_type:complete